MHPILASNENFISQSIRPPYTLQAFHNPFFWFPYITVTFCRSQNRIPSLFLLPYTRDVLVIIFIGYVYVPFKILDVATCFVGDGWRRWRQAPRTSAYGFMSPTILVLRAKCIKIVSPTYFFSMCPNSCLVLILT